MTSYLLGRSNLIPRQTVDSANDGIGKFVSIDYHVPSISDKLPTRLMNRPALANVPMRWPAISLQRNSGAVSKITGMFAWISVAGWSGTYAAVDLSHHKTVTIKGDCSDPSQTKVAGLTAQDFVVLGVQCLSTPSVTARQHVVVDVYRVHFLETSGYHANAQISSRVVLSSWAARPVT
jgi:hypothetical protein